MQKVRVLFLCIQNSGRSQMAEAFLNTLGGAKFEAESAGLEPTKINPIVVEVMKEVDIDISNKEANSVFEFFKQGRIYNYVISVCDESSSERCPLFPGKIKRLCWSFEEPAAFTGSEEEIKAKVRKLRDQIKAAIEQFIKKEPSLSWLPLEEFKTTS